VPGVGVDDEPRHRDGGGEGLLVLAAEQFVAGALHDEGRRRDRRDVRGRARADQSGERFPPYVSRHGGTVLYPALDIPLRHLMEQGIQGQGASYPGRIHRVDQLIDLISERRTPLQAGRRPHEDQPGHPVRAGDRHLLGDVPAAGGPEQHGGGDADRIHERHDVRGDLRQGIPRRWFIGVAVTAQVHRDSMQVPRQQREQPVE
jgi:hypothetical protein